MLFFPFLEPVPGHFVFIKDQVQPPLEKNLKQAYYKVSICNSKTIKICQNQHADCLRFPFTEMGPARPHFCRIF